MQEDAESEPEPEPRSSEGIRPIPPHSSFQKLQLEPNADTHHHDELANVQAAADQPRSASVLGAPSLNTTLKLRRKVAEAERCKAAAAAAALDAQTAAEIRRLEAAARSDAAHAAQSDLRPAPAIVAFHGLVPIADPAAGGGVTVLLPRRVGKQLDPGWQAALRDRPPFDPLNRPAPPPAYRAVPPLPRPDLESPFTLALPAPRGAGAGAGSGFPGGAQFLGDCGALDSLDVAALQPTPEEWW